MSTQLIDFETGSLTTGDSGERMEEESIKPYVAGERVQAVVFDRPLENLRARTEELRKKVEDLLYRADADKWIITGGNSIGQVTVPVLTAFPTVTWSTGTNKFTISEAIVLQPLMAPLEDKFASKSFVLKTATFLISANDNVAARDILFDYQLANSIRIIWEESASLGGDTCVATIEGEPEHILRIVIRDDGTTLASDVAVELNTILGPPIAASPFKFTLTSAVPVYISLSDLSAGDRDVVLTGTYSRELHHLAAAELNTFFGTTTLSADGDGIGIWYEELTDSVLSTRGGRRQATPMTAPAPNTEVLSTKLFKFSTNPEKIPGAIPLCRRIGTSLVFVDGTVVAAGQTATFGGEGSIDALLARYLTHVGGTADQHPAEDITFDDTNFNASWGLNPAEVQEAIDLVVGALDATTAPSGATRVGYAPYSWIAATTVSDVIKEIVDDLALQAGTPGTARIGNVAAVTTVWDWFTRSKDTVQAQLASVFTALNSCLPVNQTNVNPQVAVDGSDSIFQGMLRGLVAPAPSVSWKQLIEQDYGDVGSSLGVQPSIPWAPPNYRDVGTRTWVDVCPGWFWYARKPCFFAVSNEKACVYKLNHIATNSDGIGDVDIYVDWSGTYPLAMPLAVASNGKYLYVLTADSSTHRARMLQYDCYTNPLTTPTLYKNEYFDAIELWDGASAYVTSISMGTNTLAFTAKHSTGVLTADEFTVIVAQADVTSWGHGRGNIGVGAGIDNATGSLCHIGDDTYAFGYRDGSLHGFAAVQATVIGGLVTGVIVPAAGPLTVKGTGSSYMLKSCVFDGATAWFIDETGQVFAYAHKGSDASEAERWIIAFELTTNNLIDQSVGAEVRLAFDGARVWIAARAYGLNRIVMMSFDPTLMLDPVFFPAGYPAKFPMIYLNPPVTAGWASNGPTTGQGPGKIAIIADVAMVIGRLEPKDGILHRVVNLSRRGGQFA
jgi:hypothetical protein